MKVQITGDGTSNTPPRHPTGGTFRITNVPPGQYTVALDSRELVTPAGHASDHGDRKRRTGPARSGTAALGQDPRPGARRSGQARSQSADRNDALPRRRRFDLQDRSGWFFPDFRHGSRRVYAGRSRGPAEWTARRVAGPSGGRRTHDLGSHLFPERHGPLAGPADLRSRGVRPAELRGPPAGDAGLPAGRSGGR